MPLRMRILSRYGGGRPYRTSTQRALPRRSVWRSVCNCVQPAGSTSVALNDNAAGEASIPGAGRLNHRDGRLHALASSACCSPRCRPRRATWRMFSTKRSRHPELRRRRRPAVAVPRRSPVSHRRATHFIYSALSSNPHLALDVSPSRKGGQQPSISDARAENDWERG